jgi:RecB family endonuclease NucS
MEEYVSRIEEAIARNQSIVILCNCAVRYSGRAESLLPDGDRIIIIKSDNTVLVHQPAGNNPVNYMKPATSIKATVEENKLVLHSHNPLLKEYMDIAISKIYSLDSRRLEDPASIVVNGTERDMADMLYKNPGLIEDGFKPMSMEEHTKYGFIDLFGYDKNNLLTVVECKRYAGDLKAVDQLRRYVEKVKASKGLERVRGVLACPSISPNAERMLRDFGFSFVKVNPPKYLEKFGKSQRSLAHFS